ncbi:hypothetical protein R4R77_000523 [Citrobacter amalonaticus]|uniref:Phage abortive infection protein n=2 Tax=Citrobacter amalonaticus TaxID=35703 RepID=A0AAX2BKH9_CITAM|nr:hypothetical protein [Citrobacter amalonaticus]ELR9580939.1 hypothetical protein [Citrobacter amalonaticus]SAZ71380.1 conserved membrane protein of unknown function [Citrobacter amalonaticus]SAZ78082.1 conserved membrane protein of unknown function [Citrobacter amalonaticus]
MVQYLTIGNIATILFFLGITMLIYAINSNSTSVYYKFTDESLSKQRLFKFSITIPLFVALLFSLPICFQNELNFDFTPEGYDRFLRTFKLPIGIWSLSIPLVAIVAHIHRTTQTSSQLEVTKKKNIGDSFFAHHKYITEALSKFPTHVIKAKGGDFEKKVTEPYKLYNNLFKNSSYESGVSLSDIETKAVEVQMLLNEISSHIRKSSIRSDNIRGKADDLNKAIECTKQLNTLLTISMMKSDKNYLYMLRNDVGTMKLIIPYYLEDEFKEDLKFTIELVKSIFGLINKPIEIKDTLHYYIYLSNIRHYHYNAIFNNLIETDEQETYGFALTKSSSFDEDYSNYEESLKMRMYVDEVMKH